MKHLIVRFPGGNFCNLAVTFTELRGEDMIWAWREDALVGVFDLGGVEALYVSEDGRASQGECPEQPGEAGRRYTPTA